MWFVIALKEYILSYLIYLLLFQYAVTDKRGHPFIFVSAKSETTGKLLSDLGRPLWHVITHF